MNEQPTQATGEVAYKIFFDGEDGEPSWNQIDKSMRIRWAAAIYGAIESMELTQRVNQIDSDNLRLSRSYEVIRECARTLAADLAEVENEKQLLQFGRVKRTYTAENILEPLRRGIILRIKLKEQEEEKAIRKRLAENEQANNPQMRPADASRVAATETASDSDTGRLLELAPKNPSCRSAESGLVFPPLPAVDTAPTQPAMETASDDYQTRSHFDDIANGRD